MDVCAVSVHVDGSPYEAAVQVADACFEHERLRYRVAQGSKLFLADGIRAEPFIAWQLAGADYCHTLDAEDQLPTHPSSVLVPAAVIVPMKLSEARFVTQDNEVCVHRPGSPATNIWADAQLGPQQLPTRIAEALDVPGGVRLSFPSGNACTQSVPSPRCASCQGTPNDRPHCLRTT